MDEIFEKYPLPWEVYDKNLPGYRCLRDATGKLITACEDVKLLEYIANSANNRARSRITDVPYACTCGWQGVSQDCLPDVDGDGALALGCPECETIIEV